VGSRRLVDDLEGGAALDLVAGGLVRDHDTAFGRVAAAVAAVNQETRATAHAVAAGGVELVAVRHALVGVHVAQGVGSRRKRTDVLLAGARRVVAARSALAAAGIGGVDFRTIVTNAGEAVRGDVVGVRATSREVQGSYNGIASIKHSLRIQENIAHTQSHVFLAHGRERLAGLEHIVSSGEHQRDQEKGDPKEHHVTSPAEY